ncbi:MAG: hypothetical protein STSR0004_00620 [Peptococcaceae bacterium]
MTTPRALPRSFYARDTVMVAQELLGKFLVHYLPEGTAVGRIVETEAYLQNDPACHAARGMTKRNCVMFGPPGHAYIYFIYGMHYCFNVVTREEGIGEAVLIRALEPVNLPEDSQASSLPVRLTGNCSCNAPARQTDLTVRFSGSCSCNMIENPQPASLAGLPERQIGYSPVRRKSNRQKVNLCRGPARLTQAMGITKAYNGLDLTGKGPLVIWAAENVSPEKIVTTTRIGIKIGQELPLRFYVADSPYVSKGRLEAYPTGNKN